MQNLTEMHLLPQNIITYELNGSNLIVKSLLSITLELIKQS